MEFEDVTANINNTALTGNYYVNQYIQGTSITFNFSSNIDRIYGIYNSDTGMIDVNNIANKTFNVNNDLTIIIKSKI